MAVTSKPKPKPVVKEEPKAEEKPADAGMDVDGEDCPPLEAVPDNQAKEEKAMELD